MPKEVNHDERRDEILAAVAGVLADGGLRGLTIRSLAARLGGSVSMVTHYFPTRHSLLVNLGPWILKKWQGEVESLTSAGGDRTADLRAILTWLIPLTPESLVEERAGLSLLTGTESDAASVRGLRTELDEWVRGLVREHLLDLVDEDHLDSAVDILYAATRGITVCACEDRMHGRQNAGLAVLDDLLDSLGLLPAGGGTGSPTKGMRRNVRPVEYKVKEGA